MIKTLEITTRIGCSNRCSYCPQDKLLSVYKGDTVMSRDQFINILNNTPKDVQIDFTGFCEPFLNDIAPWLMRLSIERGYTTVLYTTLANFTAYEADLLKGLTFREVFFHDMGQDWGNKKELFKANVNALYWRESKIEGHLKLSRAGNLWDSETRKGKFWCGWSHKDFSRNVVLPNGDVYLCCMDYALKHKIGNIYQLKYEDLDRNKIIEMSNQEDSDIICRKCELFNHED